MRIDSIFTYLLCLQLFFACSGQNRHAAELHRYRMILYTDSTYACPIDSLCYTNYGDSSYYNEKFSLDGYFRIYPDQSHLYFEEGELKTGNKTGLWRYYNYSENESRWLISKVESYAGQSELHGKVICYSKEHIPYVIYSYIYGCQTGIQEEFYDSGTLFWRYENDSAGAYVNNYLILEPDGDTLYYENFGQSGTGWLKYYHKNNDKKPVLYYEGQLINKKREGWFYTYTPDSENNKQALYSKILYKDNIVLFACQYFFKDEKYKGSDIDSITGIYKYDYNEGMYIYTNGVSSTPVPERIIYYYKGKILGIEKNSPYF